MKNLKLSLICILTIFDCEFGHAEPSYLGLMKSGAIVFSNRSESNFEIEIKNNSESDMSCIARLAAATECEKRNFNYFDIGEETRSRTQTFCFKTKEKPGLGVTFERNELYAEPPRFIIEDLNGKKASNLMVGDEVVSLNNEKVVNMGMLKHAIFKADVKHQKVLISIIRKAKSLNVEEPVTRNSFATPVKDKWAFRMKCL